jgi:hypothetical protein
MQPLVVALKTARWRASAAPWPLALMTAMILGACGTASPGLVAPLAGIKDPVVVLPEAPVLRDDLDEPCRWQSPDKGTLSDYHCDPDERPKAGDVIFSRGRYDEIRLDRDRWLEYPWKCAGAVDDCHRGWRGEVKRVARLAIARGLQAAVEDAGWPWEVYLFAIGVGVVSAGLGGLVVWGASQLDRIP